jgi:hypothetical protein
MNLSIKLFIIGLPWTFISRLRGTKDIKKLN